MRVLGAIGWGMFMVDHSPIILDFFFFGWGGRVVGGMHQGKGLLGSKPCDSIQKDFWIVCNNGLVFSFKRIPFLF